MKFRDAAAARSAGYTFTWEDDWDLPGGSHAAHYGPGSAYDPAEGGQEPKTCESCIVYDPDGNVVGSLGCVDDADDGYRTTVEDDLARDVEVPVRVAYRVGRKVAEAAFRRGDGIVVSDRHDRGPLFEVTPWTTVNAASDDFAWSELAAGIDGWGRPQSLYVLPRGV